MYHSPGRPPRGLIQLEGEVVKGGEAPRDRALLKGEDETERADALAAAAEADGLRTESKEFVHRKDPLNLRLFYPSTSRSRIV